MKIRTVYFKVADVGRARKFWESFLDVKPHKTGKAWVEFWVGNVRLGLLLNDFGDRFSGSNCVPVFEFADRECLKMIERAKTSGAKVLVDGLDDPNLKSVVFADPDGNEFEVSRFHD